MVQKHFHPWHDVHFGNDAPVKVTALIEIAKGTKAKYEVDKISGMLKLDRILFGAMHYPANYGFIPQTLCGDGDPLDILVLCSESLERLTLVDAIVIGVMRMEDRDKPDDKIIAVAASDVSVNFYKSLAELPPNFTIEMKNFFQQYTQLEGKEVRVGNFADVETAHKIIMDNIACYRETFSHV